MNLSLKKNLIFPFVIIFYPLLLIIANISGVKINYIAAFFVILLSVLHSIRNLKILILIFTAFTLIILKFFSFGSFSIKEIVVLMTGPLIFSKFVSDVDSLNKADFYLVLNCVRYVGFLIAFVVIFQYVGFLPMTLLKMDFLNIVGVNIFGELDESFRPSAYFYHPYDTALSLVPMLVFSMMFFYKEVKASSIFYFLVFIIAVFALQLKVMFGFALIMSVFVVFFNKLTLPRFVFILLAVFLTAQVFYFAIQDYSQEEIAASAGRLVIWRVNFEAFFFDSSFVNILIGLASNPLENSILWVGEEFFTAHNLYLFMVVNTGVLFTLIFILLKSTVLRKSKLVDLCIFALMLTFSFTGDLMVYTSYWVCLSCLYLISLHLSKFSSGRFKIESNG